MMSLHSHKDVELESASKKKQHTHRSTSTKRSHAAEVHTLSERRRRDRINEKMKALQELVPRNKVDKASVLDEAIAYLKSLQTQVQVMSMGCGMVPMMYPWMQPYMPPMGMACPMLPFPSTIPGCSPLPTPPTGSVLPMSPQFAQRLLVPVFSTPPTPAHHSAAQASNQADSFSGFFPLLSSNLPPQHPNLADPYQQYMNIQQIQMQMQIQIQMQNQPYHQPSSNNASTNKSKEYNNQCG